MDGGHVHSAERQRARLPLAVHWAPIGRARAHPRRPRGWPPPLSPLLQVYEPGPYTNHRYGVDLSEGNVVSFQDLEVRRDTTLLGSHD